MPRSVRDPAEWIRRARSNLARARQAPGAPEVLLEDQCFDAQQAAEKALKAVLVFKNVKFPKTHAVAELLTLVEQAGVTVPPALYAASALTVFAVEGRYPGFAEDVTLGEYATALSSAGEVVVWASSIVGIDLSAPAARPDAIRCRFHVGTGDADVPTDLPGRAGNEVTLTLDLEDARMRDWPAGYAVSLYVKVVDRGRYELLAGELVLAVDDGGYVPECVPNEYGDYLNLDIQADGSVSGWKPDLELILRSFGFGDKPGA